MCGEGSTLKALLNREESKAIRLIIYSCLSDCHQSLTVRRNAASLAIFYRYVYGYVPLNLLPACLPSSRGLATQNFLYLLSSLSCPSTLLTQELIGIFTLSSLSPMNSGTLFLNLFFYLLQCELFQEKSIRTSMELHSPNSFWNYTPTVNGNAFIFFS